MAAADDPAEDDFTLNQLSKFDRLTAQLSPGVRHAANSATCLRFPDKGAFDMVRPGIGLYGLPPSDHLEDAGLLPIATWKATPTQVKVIHAGETVGYGRTYRADTSQVIATLPVGYADGFFRMFSSPRGYIRLSSGEECPVVGRVSMDQISVRVPHEIDLQTEFHIVTNDYDDKTSMTGRAKEAGTINYEVATSVANRVHRVYNNS
mmetsp:Transcript_65428/g.142758  ORF Transcript_65428/g.142758 Transcript_65428/m.142758 type:complete len:206 (+) Transcript_65428:51-668(+)